MDTILAWSGWATSENIVSTIPETQQKCGDNMHAHQQSMGLNFHAIIGVSLSKAEGVQPLPYMSVTDLYNYVHVYIHVHINFSTAFCTSVHDY